MPGTHLSSSPCVELMHPRALLGSSNSWPPMAPKTSPLSTQHETSPPQLAPSRGLYPQAPMVPTLHHPVGKSREERNLWDLIRQHHSPGGWRHTLSGDGMESKQGNVRQKPRKRLTIIQCHFPFITAPCRNYCSSGGFLALFHTRPVGEQGGG